MTELCGDESMADKLINRAAQETTEAMSCREVQLVVFVVVGGDMCWFLGCVTLSPIMEVENYPKWKETTIGDRPIFHWLPWVWEEGCFARNPFWHGNSGNFEVGEVWRYDTLLEV